VGGRILGAEGLKLLGRKVGTGGFRGRGGGEKGKGCGGLGGYLFFFIYLEK